MIRRGESAAWQPVRSEVAWVPRKGVNVLRLPKSQLAVCLKGLPGGRLQLLIPQGERDLEAYSKRAERKVLFQVILKVLDLCN